MKFEINIYVNVKLGVDTATWHGIDMIINTPFFSLYTNVLQHDGVYETKPFKL